MSLKSHYGWRSVPAKTDFLWFCSGGEEMREAKSLWSKIQMDMAGHEGGPLKCTAPTASFHHGGVPCSAAMSAAQCDARVERDVTSSLLLNRRSARRCFHHQTSPRRASTHTTVADLCLISVFNHTVYFGAASFMCLDICGGLLGWQRRL